MRGAVVLDPVARRIAGYAEAGPDGRPAKVEIALNGRTARTILAISAPTALSPAAIAEIGPPPTASSAFAALLPPGDQDGPVELTVSAHGAPLLLRRFDGPAALARYREGWVMTDSVSLTITRLRQGVFTGRLSVADGAPPPEVTLRLRGEDIGGATLAPDGDGHMLTAPLPADALGDGVEVVEFVAEGAVLARYPISAGASLEGDLAAEVSALRAELDHLKGAFRLLAAEGVVKRDERPLIVAEALAHVDALLERRDRARAQDAVDADEDLEDWEISE